MIYEMRTTTPIAPAGAGCRTLRHAATYTEPFALGRRLSVDDFTPTEADYRRAAPRAVMDKVRIAACR